MKVMVVGSGAREHALVWKLAGEHPADSIVCAPGNAGVAKLARCVPVDAADPDTLLAVAAREKIDLTVVGPEVPLARGVADRFAAQGRALFGPSQAAARLESSKAFAKDFMARRGVPTARYQVFDDARKASAAVRGGRFGFPVVLKADGLAAGKGVTVAEDTASADQAVRDMLVDRCLGDAGASLVMEEFLEGEEASFFAVCDGHCAVALPSAQDHKRAFDDDRGPNTGGMGAYAPSPRMTEEVRRRVMQEIVEPVLDGLREEGHPYRGLLYVGLMLTADGPRVVEFNVRFGDPEAQVILPMLDGPLTPLLSAAASGSLAGMSCPVKSDPHVGIVVASGGYPDAYETGLPIEGLNQAEQIDDVLVFHAGTKQGDSGIVTAGGRVLTVVARGDGFAQAIARVYDAVGHIRFRGKHVRLDIGRRALQAVSGT